MPALVVADIPVGLRLREMVRQFLRSQLILEKDRTQFTRVVAHAVKSRDSRLAQTIVLALAYVTTYLNFVQFRLQDANTWYAPVPGAHLSLAGYWYFLVAIPLFQFLMYRWLYRMYIWATLLW